VFPSSRKKSVPPRLLLESTVPNAERLIAERAGDEKRRAENKARSVAILARRQQRVDNIRWAFQIPANRSTLDVLRAERIARANQKAMAAHLAAHGRTLRTRGSDAKLRAEQESALGEMMAQLDAEDEEGEPSGSDSDYEDEGAGAAPTTQDSASSAGEATSDNLVAGDDDEGASSDSEVADDGADIAGGEDDQGDTAEELESEASQSSRHEDPASGLSQKRHRKGNRNAAKKSARSEMTMAPRDGGPAGDGAFLEGFTCR
jgi:hypothetical protein